MLRGQQLGASGRGTGFLESSQSQDPRGFAGPSQPVDRRCIDKVFCKSETLEICYYEWSADRAALASDGQYWRSVFGGARLVLGTVRCSPSIFLIFRICLTAATGTVFYYQLLNPVQLTWHVLLYFDTWVCIVQGLYFLLATTLTGIATMTTGGITRSTPFVIRLTELAYSVLIPSTLVLAISTFCVEYVHFKHCVPSIAQHNEKRVVLQCVLDTALLVIILLDATFNRQPYYASFNALIGTAFCYTYLGFTAAYQALGGTDVWGHNYIYRCLDWSLPLSGSRTATGKLLMANFFVFIPLLNFAYWFLLWARRRTLAHSKATANRESASKSLLAPQPPAIGRRWIFEYGADWRDLRLDGRHWQAQFGGSSHVAQESVGAYVCCNGVWFALSRFVFAVCMIAMMEGRLLHFVKHHHRWWCLFLYMQNWLLVLGTLYFVLAFLLTARATCLPGGVATSTPFFVWLVWALNGMCLPLALCSAIIYPLVQASDDFEDANTLFSWACVYFTVFLVFLDAFINRQPYYATFHGFFGVAICWAYLIFLILFPALGGTNEFGEPYIYAQFTTPSSWTSLGQIFTAAKVFTVQTLLLLPLYMAFYWCTLWAVRRARVAAKKQQLS